MKLHLRGLASAVLFGLGLPLLVSGCGPKIKDPHEMWDRLVAEKSITAIASVKISYVKGKGYWLTVFAIDSAGQKTGHNINYSGELTDYLDQGVNEWQGRVNLSPAEVDLDALVARIPSEDASYQGCGSSREAVLEVMPTGKLASWTGCSNSSYNEGSLLVDGKPVLDQADPHDPAQVAAMAESYASIFGAGTLVEWHAGVQEGQSTFVRAIPFADDSNCVLDFFLLAT